jgi:hypothetical protein
LLEISTFEQIFFELVSTPPPIMRAADVGTVFQERVSIIRHIGNEVERAKIGAPSLALAGVRIAFTRRFTRQMLAANSNGALVTALRILLCPSAFELSRLRTLAPITPADCKAAFHRPDVLTPSLAGKVI